MDATSKFQKLTPTENIDMGIYKSAMDYAFEEDSIKNIAVTGIYGAGKSSMIQTYKNVENKKFIHISLAHFSSEDEELQVPGNNKTENEKVAWLEGKIINQLIHQIDPKKIEQTKFSIKQDIERKQIVLISGLITLFVAITCFLMYKQTWENMILGFSWDFLKKIFIFTTTKEIEIIFGFIALLIFSVAVYKIVRQQKSIKLLKKLNLQGNEIELFEESKESYFDRYLNEVLYIFKHADVDAVVFEDIDRYNTNLIFEKLREVNFLLNQKLDNQQIIKFFYLLRDDLFQNKDRTKFFDFIIPVVPVVDTSNAYDKFIEYFKNAGILDNFDSSFVQELSLYIDDMRVLKNICNEFLIYQEKLNANTSIQSNNKLLAMITYKNLFPKDFGNLHIRRGYVYALFENKEKFKSKKILQLKTQIEELQLENKNIELEMCQSIDDLNAIYFVINGRILVDGKEEQAYKTRSAFVKAILNSTDIRRYGTSYSNSLSMININNEKKAMEENPEYIERKKNIQKKGSELIKKNKHKISTLREEIKVIEEAYLKDVVATSNEAFFSENLEDVLGAVETYEKINKDPNYGLIRYLICNGYIDETYPDYMTYFYANSICVNDKMFLRSIIEKNPKAYEYKLEDAELIISRMRDVDFNGKEALNYNLLDMLLLKKEKYDVQLYNLLENIYRNDNTDDFLSGYLKRNSNRSLFVEVFNQYSEMACLRIIESELGIEEKRQYIIDTLCISTDEDIEANTGEIKNFINNDADFLSVQATDEEAVGRRLINLEVCFESINFSNANLKLLQYVYTNNLYSLRNMENVKSVIRIFYEIDEIRDSIILSLIFSQKEQPLYKYAFMNFDIILEGLCKKTNYIEDSEEVIVYILNHESISEESKKAYICLLKTQINCLESVKEEVLWTDLLDANIVAKKSKNICDYYYSMDKGIDASLINYINSFETPRLDNVLDDLKDKTEDDKYKFFVECVNCNKIETKKYESWICSFGMQCEDLAEENLSSDKVDVLIENNLIKMNQVTLQTFRNFYPSHSNKFILSNIDEYAQIMDAELFSMSELRMLLEEDIAEDIKLNILHYADEPISIKDKSYSNSVQEYIVKNLYCEDDFEYLLSWYPANREKLRTIIQELALLNIPNINSILHFDLFIYLIDSDNITIAQKKHLIKTQIVSGMDSKNVRTAFNRLNMREYSSLFEGKRPKIANTKEDVALLSALVAKKWISSYEVDKQDTNYLQAYGKKKKRLKFIETGK